MNYRSVEDDQPWYRQFWPWFLIALPASVVVAGLTTVYIAFKGADALVNDNYYRDGLAINQRLDQDRLAAEMGLSAIIKLDNASGELFVQLDGQKVSANQLVVQLLHPTDGNRDRELLMSSTSQGNYRVDLDAPLKHRYYLRLMPEPDRQWRLSGEIDGTVTAEVRLDAETRSKAP